MTFLLSDIEGSSRLWETEPEAMAQTVPAVYAILDEAVAGHGGVRPVEQGEGDSVVGAFARASDAVGAALEAQLALHRQVWPGGIELRLRIAVHTAEAQLRDQGNCAGSVVPVEQSIAWARARRARAPDDRLGIAHADRGTDRRTRRRGLTNPKIGERMFISRTTVKIHLAHIYSKLGIHSRTELAVAATAPERWHSPV